MVEDLLAGKAVEIAEVEAAVVHLETQEEAVDASRLEEVAAVVVEIVQIAEVEVLRQTREAEVVEIDLGVAHSHPNEGVAAPSFWVSFAAIETLEQA